MGKKLVVKLDLSLYLDFYHIPLDTGRKLNVLDFFWTSYVRFICVMRPERFL